MHDKANNALVGCFVLGLGAALVGGVFWLAVGGENRIYDQYRVYFPESVAGLNVKAAVRYRGVQVGQVSSIQLDPHNPDQVEVVLNIERGIPIRRDTIATLSTRGLTGVATVELSGGGTSPPVEREPGQDLPVLKAGPSWVARLDEALNQVLTDFNRLSNRLERLLSDENQLALSQTLRNVATVTGAVADRAESIRQTLAHAETVSAALARRAERLGKALDQVTEEIESMRGMGENVRAMLREIQAGVHAVRNAAVQFQKTSSAFAALSGDGQREIQRLGQSAFPELVAVLKQAQEAMAAWQRLADLLEQHPRALWLGKPQGRPGPGE